MKKNVLMLIAFMVCISGCAASRNIGPSSDTDRGPHLKYPAFFYDIESIRVKDELGRFIGTSEDGIMEMTYLDTVRMAGHSCAKVGGAYLIALEGLKALYKGETPRRGEIKVELKHSPTEDNTGVVGFVLSNITGATSDYGFGGLPGGKFSRRGLLFYEAEIDTDVRFTRLDTNKHIGVNCHPEKAVKPMAILMSAIGPDATPEDKRTFPKRFQNMVKTLFENKGRVIEIVE